MKEILWVLLTSLSLLAFILARARLRKLQWALVLGALLLLGGFYIARHGPLRVGMNMFLFIERHHVLFVVLLALGVIGVVFAWRARWTALGWVAGLIAAIAVNLLFVKSRAITYWLAVGSAAKFPWDLVMFVLLLTLSIIGLILARRSRLQPLGWVSAVMIVAVAAGLFLSSTLYGTPEDFVDIEDQFKYGSIGSDHMMARGIPYWIWKVMPEAFPPNDVLPGDFRPTNRTNSYEDIGLLQENEHKVRVIGQDKEIVIARPIGFSKRQVFGIDFIGINCAFCHVSTIRMDAKSQPKIVLGMPANGVDIELFFRYLFITAEQPDFYAKVAPAVTKAIWEEPMPDTNIIQQYAYRAGTTFFYRVGLIPITRYYANRLKKDFYFIDPDNENRLPRFGPGRVDTWAPAKAALVTPPLPVTPPGGIADYPAIWNQKARAGMGMHWDGNIDVLEERNIIAGLVVTGPCLKCLDLQRVKRVTDWITSLPPPRYEDEVNGYEQGIKWDRVNQGKVLFRNYCAACHAPDGDRVGRVEPFAALQTDRARGQSFTLELADAFNKLKTDSWRLRSFKPQNGYVNLLLDGIWLRAPYLHNGSVPTLWDLLEKPDKRPPKFYRGNDMYDGVKVGFTSEVPEAEGRKFFEYDTVVVPGNANGGHVYGTDLSDGDKHALIEYLKTL